MIKFKGITIIFLLLIQYSILYAQRKPNLVIIHTDEHNFRTLSCYRDKMNKEEAYVWGDGLGVETTNIDKIADEGAICMNYYAASPVCAPSRGSMLTGLYRQSHGVIKNGLPLNKNIKTIGHILSDAGYSTSYVGKWHLSNVKEKYVFDFDQDTGFMDKTYMMTGGHAPYFKISGNKITSVNENNLEKYKENEITHLTDFFTKKTIEIIKRDKNKPFCVMVSIPDPHTPDYAKPPYDVMYKDMDLKMPKTMLKENLEKRPEWAKGGKNDAFGKDKNGKSKNGFNPEKLKQYFGMVKHIDDKVGEILDCIKNNNLEDSTIVVFTSDHGDMFYEHGKLNKGLPYEGSSKIGFVIKYPKKINKGKVIRKAYSNVSFTPTMLGLMEVKTKLNFEGEDMSDDLVSKDKNIINDEYIHISEANNIWVALINRRYKLVLNRKYSPWLFDLKKDPHETINFFNSKGYEKLSKDLMENLVTRMKSFKEPAYLSKSGLKYK